MGTNYYLKLHLGKASAGPNGVLIWTWDESVLPHRDFLHALPDGEVTDEYSRDISPDELMEILKVSVVRYSDRGFS